MMVWEVKLIARKYMSSRRCWYDLLGSVPFDTFMRVYGHPHTADWMRVLRFFRLQRISYFRQVVMAFVRP